MLLNIFLHPDYFHSDDEAMLIIFPLFVAAICDRCGLVISSCYVITNNSTAPNEKYLGKRLEWCSTNTVYIYI